MRNMSSYISYKPSNCSVSINRKLIRGLNRPLVPTLTGNLKEKSDRMPIKAQDCVRVSAYFFSRFCSSTNLFSAARGVSRLTSISCSSLIT